MLRQTAGGTMGTAVDRKPKTLSVAAAIGSVLCALGSVIASFDSRGGTYVMAAMSAVFTLSVFVFGAYAIWVQSP